MEPQTGCGIALEKSMLTEVEQAGLKGVRVSFQDFDGLKKTVRITAEVLGDESP